MTALAPVQSPPLANVESEYVLLACMLYDSRRVEAVADILAPEDFSEPFFGRVYSVIVRECAAGKPVTAMTIRPYLEPDPGYAEMGGWEFLAKITSAATLLVDHRIAAKQIVELARRRRFIDGMREALACAADPNEAIEIAVELADTAIGSTAVSGSAILQISAAEAMQRLLNSADQPKRGVRSGLETIDDLIGSLRPGDLQIWAGRPGMGKTAAALSYAVRAARQGHGVLFVTLEMAADELSERIASDLSFNGSTGVAYADIGSDNPSPSARHAMQSAITMLADLPFQMIDTGTLTLARLDMLVRRWVRRFEARGQKLELVVVDYLQLLRAPGLGSRYEEVTEISRSLKALAKDHGTSVLALAQLSRKVEDRADKRPHLADLKESGQIEQDADGVMFLYRHEYYLKMAEPRPEEESRYKWEEALRTCEGQIEFICAKRRKGVTGSAMGRFYGAFQAVRG